MVASAFEWRQGAAGLALVCRPLEPHARHLFSTRSLRYRGDELEGDRRRVASALGVTGPDLVAVAHVHGCTVVSVEPSEDIPAGSEGDALVTTDTSRAVSVVVADCVPVLIGDRRRRVVAAVHAGWRGTAAGIVGAVVSRLRSLGVAPGELVAAIGPSIGPCCYQVDAPVRQAFSTRDADAGAWFAPDGAEHWRLDLWRANLDQLTRAGVPAASVHVARVCTADHPETCWSYRREGPTAGRMVAAITLHR